MTKSPRPLHDADISVVSSPSSCSLSMEHDRAALLGVAIFVFFVLSVQKFNLPAVIAYGSFPLFIILISRISASTILRRLAVISPFILFMAVSNLFFDRRPLLDWFGFIVTGGMLSGMVIAAKTMVTTAALLSLTAAVPFHRLAVALRGLGVPEVFVTQLILLYRYSFVLADEASAMQLARDMRSFGNRGRDLFTTARLIGSLLVRTTSKAERIYMAMSARGFNSMLTKRRAAPVSLKETATVITVSLFFLAIRILFQP